MNEAIIVATAVTYLIPVEQGTALAQLECFRSSGIDFLDLLGALLMMAA